MEKLPFWRYVDAVALLGSRILEVDTRQVWVKLLKFVANAAINHHFEF